MAKIIVFGDIDITPLYLTLDDYREMTIAGKWPICLNVAAGWHNIAATTVTKFQRRVRTPSTDFFSWAANAMTDGMNTSIAGQIAMEDDEILLIQVKNSLTKSHVYNQLVPASEAERYVDMDTVVNYGERAPGEKNKWVAFFLCLFFGFLGAHRFYEGKIATGILYLCTLGLCGAGVLVDLVKIWHRSGSAVPASERARDQERPSRGGGLAAVLVILLAVVGLGAVLLFMGRPLLAGSLIPSGITEQTQPPAVETLAAEPLYQEGGFVFPDSDTTPIAAWEAEHLPDDDLNDAINELYARHGYIFRSDELLEYYGQFSWYSPQIPAGDFSVDCFNQVELQNWSLLVEERNSRKASG